MCISSRASSNPQMVLQPSGVRARLTLRQGGLKSPDIALTCLGQLAANITVWRMSKHLLVNGDAFVVLAGIYLGALCACL